jgi:hypothetical protein
MGHTICCDGGPPGDDELDAPLEPELAAVEA